MTRSSRLATGAAALAVTGLGIVVTSASAQIVRAGVLEAERDARAAQVSRDGDRPGVDERSGRA